MAKSEFEYVREQERDDRLPKFNWIVVRISSCDSSRFEDQNDECLSNLMNVSAKSLLEKFADIVFAYGFGPEFSFIWKETTTFYERRESKILSLSISFFTSAYVMKFKEFFPNQELEFQPSFNGQIICFPGPGGKLIRDYLSLRQQLCHFYNQRYVCLLALMKNGKTMIEAEKYLEGMQESGMNELLFKEFGINYNNLTAVFRKGSSIFKEQVEEVVKLNDAGNPITRTRNRIKLEHKDLTWSCFWRFHPQFFPD
ncbi:tRNA(His) guanylyltransferase 1-like [Wolffia australiana]